VGLIDTDSDSEFNHTTALVAIDKSKLEEGLERYSMLYGKPFSGYSYSYFEIEGSWTMCGS